MSPSTFQIQESGRYSLRPAWLVTVAPLGRLAGDDCTLIGLCRDWHAEDGRLDWGIATGADVTRLEMQTGKRLTDLFEKGETVEGWISDAPSRVVDLKALEVRQSSPARPATASSTQLQKLSTNATRYEDFAAAVAEAGVMVERVEKQREAALALRKTWSISEMKHRSDWPAWLPGWIREVVKESSRTWLELPNAPVPTPEPPPIIQAAHVEPTPAPVAAEQTLIGKFRTAFSL